MKWVLPLLSLILLAPLTLVDVPPLLDYPNHLARAFVLASGAADPIVSGMYAARWDVIPNLGIDLLLPPLLHVLPVHDAGRIIVGLAIALPVLGTIAYSRATFRTAAAWPLASVLVAYNATFLLGFLNFVIGIGGALLLAAAWIAWRDSYPVRIVVLTVLGTVALFFCHLMGLVFFFILIAGHELQRVWQHRAPFPAIARRAAALAPLLATSLGLYAASPLAPLSGQTEWSSLATKGTLLILPFTNYILALDIVAACLVGAFLLACAASGRCRVTLASGIVLALTALAFLAAPWAFKGTYFLDARFVIMLGFLLFGAVLPEGLPRPAAVAAAGTFVLLFAVRMAVVSHTWDQHRHDVQDLRRVISAVEPGARVLVASVTPEAAPAYWQSTPQSRKLSLGLRLDHHLPALLLIEHRAYWPFLFDNASQQPIETRPPYRELAARAEAIVDHRTLAVPGKVDLCGYQYLLLLEAGGEPDLAQFAADRLTLAAHSDIAALFRVKPSACGLPM